MQFGISSSEPLAKARSEGIPIVSIAAIIQHNTSGFASLEEGEYRPPEGLRGQAVRLLRLRHREGAVTKLMQADGGDVSKVEFVEIGDADFLTLAQKGQVDFAWVFEGWEVIDGKLRGLDLNYLPLTAWQQVVPDYYTPIFITNEEMTQKRGDIVKKFLAATSKGYNDAIADPKGTARHPRQGDAGDEHGPDPAEPGISRQAIQGGRPALGRSEAERLADLRRLHDRAETARQALRPDQGIHDGVLAVGKP